MRCRQLDGWMSGRRRSHSRVPVAERPVPVAGNVMVPIDSQAADGAAAEAVGGSSGAGSSSSNGGDDGSAAADRQREVMTVIDFEYADWAPRGFDWGNHFCE